MERQVSADLVTAATRAILAILVGILAGQVAVTMTLIEPRYALVIATAVIGGLVMICLGSLRRALHALIVVMALTLPIGFQITFLTNVRAIDQHVDHMTSVGGITVTVPMIAATVILLLSILAGRSRSIFVGLRIDPVMASGAAGLFIAGLLSLFNAADWTLTGFELLRILLAFVLFTLLFTNLDRPTLTVYLRAIAAMVLIQGVTATVQFVVGGEIGGGILGQQVDPIDGGRITRAGGILGGPNGLAGSLEVFLPMIVGLALTQPRGGERLFYACASIAGLAGVFASLSRGAFVALPLPLLMVVLALGWRRLWSLKGALAAVVGLICLAAAAVAVGPTIVKRMTADDGGSAASRVPMALGALGLIEQRPLFGVGLNNYADSLARLDRLGFAREFKGGNGIVHNMYLWTWAETGTVGLLALMWYFGAAFWRSALIWRRSIGPSFERAIAIGVAGGFLAPLTHGLFDPGFRLGTGAFMIAAQMGLLAAVYLAAKPASPAPAARPTTEPRHARG